MATEAWRVLAELERPTRAELELGGAGGLAALVRELNLPDTLIEQMRRAVSVALQRVVERGDRQTVRLRLSTEAVPARRSGTSGGWGFFLIDKPPDETQPHRIELFLYQDTNSDRSGEAGAQQS